MMRKLLSASVITHFVHELGLPPQADEHYEWVIVRVVNNNHNTRRLSSEAHTAIKASITSIPSGRQRRLKIALDHVLLYLQQVCQWQLPEDKTRLYPDQRYHWIQHVMFHAHLGGAVYNHYTRQEWALQYKTLNAAELINLLAIEVAPLSLTFWIDVLQRPNSIEVFEEKITLLVYHPITRKDELPSFSRYTLTPVACRALVAYHKRARTHKTTRRVTEASIMSAFNEVVESLHVLHPQLKRSYSNPIKAREWHLAMQAIWHCEYGYPPELLLDMVQPTRHYAYSRATVSDWHTRKALSALHTLPFKAYSTQSSLKASENSGITATAKDAPRSWYWPHLALLKRLNNEPRSALETELNTDVEWRVEDVLPTLFLLFTIELILHGGVKRDRLSYSTLVKYTGIYNKLPGPLSYLEASDPIRCDEWAKAAFESQDSDEQQWLVYNFLRFMSHQALTDHLDLTQFQCPTQSMNVDAYRLDAEEVHRAAEVLLDSPNGALLPRLFSAVALLLSFYGALRRGEIIRLRLRDVLSTSLNGAQFRLHITETCEGTTKSGQSRYVHVVMPTCAANLLTTLLEIKRTCNPSTPLLGFEGESRNSRERHYLYPVTQALKALYGNQVRFHHLRHSGAHLLTLQGLSLACGFYEHSGVDVLSAEMLTKAACEARFAFWLEGREFSELNDGLLLDMISEQLGHRYYATTRLCYLHGIEWLPQFFSQPRAYSRRALEALLGKPACAFVLSLPKMAVQQPNHDDSSGNGKVSLSDAQLTEFLLISPFGSTLPNTELSKMQSPVSTDDDALLRTWRNVEYNNQYPQITFTPRSHPVPAFQWQTEALVTALKSGEMGFDTVSAFWQLTGRHRVIGLSKAQRSALTQLGPITRLDDRQFSVSFACNQSNAKAFKALFRAPLFHCFNLSFLLLQNRKQSPKRKLALINTHFSQRGEPVTAQTIAEGESQFIVIFSLTPDGPLLFRTLMNYLH
ncbi:hypothetical protein BCS94_09995 [Vibrio breoganii]|uniref:site-specific integrase n=1 Tax=Vibrio breoganii TaxID=553239 RepID=UPI000C838E99|nr:site-specific integrase [Vibrio breoganii]PMP07287.1 hypothetical protein BCS94_09995 [Vibrio breoganii]